jgi:steroid 5-alpha reductase family enzyme
MTSVLLSGLGAVMALMLIGWLVSLAMHDASIVDILWGLAFVTIAWVTFGVGHGSPGRSLLFALLVTIWGVRLALYLAKRNLGHGEDFRYQAMRKKRANFALWSLFGVFGLQGILAWIVSLPVQIAMHDATPHRLGVLAYVGGALWLVGLGFESIGDWQLARFKANPASAGQVMDAGLWRFTRHPNYFGDFCVWWGLFIIAVECGSAVVGVIGPLVMSILLTRVSGKDLLERSIGKRRPGYADYVKRTNAFFPGPPRKA